jgi:hypothetical protein
VVAKIRKIGKDLLNLGNKLIKAKSLRHLNLLLFSAHARRLAVLFIRFQQDYPKFRIAALLVCDLTIA